MNSTEEQAPANKKRKHNEAKVPNRKIVTVANIPPKSLHPGKRRKLLDAREISVQGSEAAFRDGQFDIVSFVNSREYEIKSLLRSMNSSKNAQRKRAFQSLPRELRRRTAAHSASRVPKRVRAVARMELVDDNTIISNKRRDYRPNIRRRNAIQLQALSKKPISVGINLTNREKPLKNSSGCSHTASKSSRYRKRQRNKTWLPTHIWCAKRARMISKWGFAVAETPTLKCYRPTYRSATREGCVAFDTSYHATLLLEGQEGDLKRCLIQFLPPKDLAIVGKMVVSGKAAASTWIHEEGVWPVGTIAPIQIIWCPEMKLSSGSDEKKCSQKRKVVLRAHPASWDDVLRIVTDCANRTNCRVRDLRFEIGSIRLMGPRSVSVLKLLMQTKACNSGIEIDWLSRNDVVYESIVDPRTNSTHIHNRNPPALPTYKGTKQTIEAQRNLFDIDCRNLSVKGQVSQKTLNARISKAGLLGHIEEALRSEVPLVLIKETLGERVNMPNKRRNEFDSHDCWTILLPWKWVRPFWLVLMRVTGVKLGGLKELEQLTLEGGSGHFPIDFPITPAGKGEASNRYQERLTSLKRRSVMKTKNATKRSLGMGSINVEEEYGYPWDKLFGVTCCLNTDKNSKLWHLSPDLVRLFYQAPQHTLPVSISSATFTVSIRLIGRGSVEAKASIFSLPRPGTLLFKQLRLQCARNGKDTAKFLEILDHYEKPGPIEASRGNLVAEEPLGNQNSLIGFIVRGSFGYTEGLPVAMAVLAWSKVWGVGIQGGGGYNGWCTLQNKDGGIVRLAQWTAI
ncbi:hypothetical protein ABW20_dc0102311 [Dactylellina cionopaga]|nr:hypothetical protein ABW20_dc0102311 [Dactylellina cionopaga]